MDTPPGGSPHSACLTSLEDILEGHPGFSLFGTEVPAAQLHSLALLPVPLLPAPLLPAPLLPAPLLPAPLLPTSLPHRLGSPEHSPGTRVPTQP